MLQDLPSYVIILSLLALSAERSVALYRPVALTAVQVPPAGVHRPPVPAPHEVPPPARLAGQHRSRPPVLPLHLPLLPGGRVVYQPTESS